MTHCGILHLRFTLPATTLKEKRAIVKSVAERLRSRFNASVAEVDDLDTPGRATLGVAVLSNDARHADRQLQEIARTFAGWRLDVVLEDVATEVIAVS